MALVTDAVDGPPVSLEPHPFKVLLSLPLSLECLPEGFIQIHRTVLHPGTWKAEVLEINIP